LSGIAVAGVVGTVVLAVKATPKAMEAAEAAVAHKTENTPEVNGVFDTYFTRRDLVMATWRCYIPTAIAGTATIACIIGGNAIGLRQQAAVLGAYTLVDGAFREYKDKVHEIISAPKARNIDDEIAKDRLEKNPPVDKQVIITGLGEQLCYDSLTGRYFKSDIEAIRKAANEVNAKVLADMYAPQDEFYELLGLGPTTIGQELGWTIDVRLELVFTSNLSPSGEPCLAIGYEKLPVYNFDKL
jgi:hypothetical protein